MARTFAHVLVVFPFAVLSACSDNRTLLTDDSDGGWPTEIRTRVDALGASDGCPAGLIKVSSGVDADGDGLLVDEEIDSDHTFCLTEVSGVETAGSLVLIEPEAAGDHCASGGQKIVVGSDNGAGDGGATAYDGKLEGEEISQTEYVCNGVNGNDGTLVIVDAEPPGSNCARGGSRLRSGKDDGSGEGIAGDGKLQPGEVESTSYTCTGDTGAAGYASLTKTSVEPQGPSCPNGGQKIEIGLDNGDGSGVAGDAKLASGEVDSRAYVCNGAKGANGADGANGMTPLFNIVAVSSGTECPAGGHRIELGYDNGDGSGTAGNSTLEPGEVNATTYVCDGADGENGSSGATLLAQSVTEIAGSNCAAGGFKLTLGFDDGRGTGTAGDQQLDDEELISTQYVCNGVDGSDGYSTLALTETIDPGATCASGGSWVHVGLDNGEGDGTSRDGVLSSGEVDHTFAMCDGRDGVNVLVVRSSASMIDCPTGGFHIEMGPDDGANDGVASDGTLQAGEVVVSEDLCNGDQGDAGSSVLMAQAVVGVGELGCATGGTLLSWGLDNGDDGGVAGDGTLDSGEVDDTSVVCNGDQGTAGFASLLQVTAADLADCPAGGSHLAFGLDNGDSGGTPRDGTLQAGEIDVEYDTCHGQGGATGAQGAAGYDALLATTTLLAGEMSCAEGGSYLTWGLDNGDGAGTARDGTLQSGEVDGSEVICNGDTGAQGVAGPATLTSTFDLDPGVTCSNGGLRLDFGGDDGDPGGTAGDGILDPQEIDDTKIICNGVDGSSGNTGSAGYNSLVSTSSNVGPNCATTGLRIDTGLDNGDGAGTARDGTLQAGEIDQTSYVCDGQDGGGGIGMGTILDANNVNLGTLIDFGDYGVTGMTSEGYLFSISWQGAYFDSQIYSSQAACGNGGSLWLNAGTTDPYEMFAKSLVYYGYDDNLYVPANANANGVATSVAFSATSLWNYGSCSGAGNNGGWLLSLVTRASVGLPATITAPLTLQ